MNVRAWQLFDAMVDEAKNRDDRAAIGSDERRAERLGISRMTVHRWKCQLRDAGLIKHDGYHVWDQRLPTGHPKRTVRWVFPQGVRRLRVTQRSSSRRPETSRPCLPKSKSSSSPSNAYGRTRSRRATKCAPPGRRRRLMENHPERISEGVVRKGGATTPFNAGDAVAAATDVCREMGIPLAPSVRGRLGKGAKALLEADFEPLIVVAACVRAVRTGWYGSVESLGQEIAVASAGGHLSRSEHQASLAIITAQLKTSESPVWQLMRDELERRERAKKRGLES